MRYKHILTTHVRERMSERKVPSETIDKATKLINDSIGKLNKNGKNKIILTKDGLNHLLIYAIDKKIVYITTYEINDLKVSKMKRLNNTARVLHIKD